MSDADDTINWHLIAEEDDGHRTWSATVTRGAPWDPGYLIEHVMLVGHDPGSGSYLWQTILNDTAGPNTDDSGYLPTFTDAVNAAYAHLASQPNLGVAHVDGPAVIQSRSSNPRGE